MAINISLPNYPATNRTYGVSTDVDGSKANTSLFQQRTLLIGQGLAGVGAMNTPILVTSLLQVGQLFGVRSMIYAQVAQYLKSDTFAELWIMAVADPTGAAATGTITVGGSFGAGLLSLYVGGVYIPLNIVMGSSPTAVAAAIALAIDANISCPVVATAVGPVVTFTAAHAGLLGNDIDIRFNYLGTLGGQSPIAGMTLAVVPMSGGTGVPSFTAALAATTDIAYDFVGTPYTDTASLQALDAYFNFTTGRWSWQQMLFGGYFTAVRGTPGQLATIGTARNGPNGSCLGFYDSPDPVWVVAADYCATCAASLRVDPNVPLQNLVMNFQAPPVTSAFLRSIRNTMLYDGISTYTINRAGQVELERAVTFYQTNAAGVADNAYLDVETMYGLMLLIRGWQQEMIRLYPRAKLFQDGNVIPAGANATTAKQIRIATISWYRTECANGNAQNADEFAAAALDQNAGNGLVKALLPFIVPNQLRNIAGLVQFLKL